MTSTNEQQQRQKDEEAYRAWIKKVELRIDAYTAWHAALAHCRAEEVAEKQCLIDEQQVTIGKLRRRVEELEELEKEVKWLRLVVDSRPVWRKWPEEKPTKDGMYYCTMEDSRDGTTQLWPWEDDGRKFYWLDNVPPTPANDSQTKEEK